MDEQVAGLGAFRVVTIGRHGCQCCQRLLIVTFFQLGQSLLAAEARRGSDGLNER